MSTIRLFTPGPVQIPESVLRAMEHPMSHHRTPEFEAAFRETQAKLQRLVNGCEPPVFLTCSGTGGLEAALINCCKRGEKVGYLSGGKFGERWGKIADQHGIESAALEVKWGESPTVEAVGEFLLKNPDLEAFCVQYCETSTTVLHDVPAIAKLLQQEFPDLLFLVDAISAATALPLDQQELGIDALVMASQKAFMLPPGLSMLSLSERYWDAAEGTDPASLYLNLKLERASQQKGRAAWTPALSLIYGLLEVMNRLEEEGYEASYTRHAEAAARCREGLQSLNFSLVTDHPSPTVTGASPPEGVDAEELRKSLLASSGIRIAGGQGDWKGRVIRVGHMGIVSASDIDFLLSQVSQFLR